MGIGGWWVVDVTLIYDWLKGHRRRHVRPGRRRARPAERRRQGKTDRLDAYRAARSVQSSESHHRSEERLDRAATSSQRHPPLSGQGPTSRDAPGRGAVGQRLSTLPGSLSRSDRDQARCCSRSRRSPSVPDGPIGIDSPAEVIVKPMPHFTHRQSPSVLRPGPSGDEHLAKAGRARPCSMPSNAPSPARSSTPSQATVQCPTTAICDQHAEPRTSHRPPQPPTSASDQRESANATATGSTPLDTQ